ncbi:response regulator [Chitinophaga lutea]|uniref:Response regulator n=1 Tax=Chitinophaga lutea TaxID=2488634 RepID=A0A3N4PYY2_9BACT|nr:response regulator [Chitinophaga lutea]RPE13096.1 response regulator [Chitinophaga lutea]
MQFLGHALRSVLLAEDDQDDQEMLAYAFREIAPQVAVISVPNGKKFMSYLESIGEGELPALIILDYNLPEVTGAEILNLLKSDRRYAHIPKIIWSTSASPVYRAICKTLGARDYIVKPSDMATYLSTARHMLTFIEEPMR